jgi:dolichol-phosphate mannosyltransferase
MRPLVIIPLYNEAETAIQVVRAVLRWAPPAARVAVIDDGSTDGSARAVARLRGVEVVRHEENRGYGASLIHGFAIARERGHDVAVTLDCDAQHEPQLIPQLLAELDGADILSGSRYLPGSERGCAAPPDRVAINREITARIRALTGLAITDAFCGFKAYRVAALAGLRLDEPSYGLPLQLWIQAARRGLRVRERAVGRIYQRSIRDRRFWRGLDDPEVRRRYYLGIIQREVERWQEPRARSS